MEPNFSTTSAVPRPERSERGFTLLEILVAVGILSIVMATVYGTTASTLSATRHAEERAEVDSLGRDVVLRIADELEGALRLGFFGVQGQGQAPTDAVQFISVVKRRSGRGGQAIVSYSLDPLEGTQGVFALRRHEELIIDEVADESGDEYEDDGDFDATEGDAAVDAGEFEGDEEGAGDFGPQVTDVYLLDNVVGLQLRYLDAETGEFVAEWNSGEDEDGAIIRNLPAAVEILLLLADANGGIHDFRTHVDLPLFQLEQTAPNS
jgi:prepilin-type N-terminal cleavage/methylation domain-containing protein